MGSPKNTPRILHYSDAQYYFFIAVSEILKIIFG